MKYRMLRVESVCLIFSWTKGLLAAAGKKPRLLLTAECYVKHLGSGTCGYC